jgi:hypothetical protein
MSWQRTVEGPPTPRNAPGGSCRTGRARTLSHIVCAWRLYSLAAMQQSVQGDKTRVLGKVPFILDNVFYQE